MKTNKLYFSIIAFCLITNLKAQFICGDSLFDTRDGQKYETVLIGSDCWFQQNLNYGTWVISDSTGCFHSDMFNNSIPEKYSVNNDSNNLAIYGGLYEWSELMNYIYTSGGQGLCPNGWHVSTDPEWQNLITTAGGFINNDSAGIGGNSLKKIGQGVGQGAGTDVVGISLLLSGDRGGPGMFWGFGQRGIFWTSTLSTPTKAYHYTLWTDNDTIERLELGLVTTGFSCRCVQNTLTGLIENENKFGVTLYPNPTTDKINLQFNEVSNITVQIYNYCGELVIQSTIYEHTTNLTIDISSQPSGIYLIKVSNGNSINIQKVVLQK